MPTWPRAGPQPVLLKRNAPSEDCAGTNKSKHCFRRCVHKTRTSRKRHNPHDHRLKPPTAFGTSSSQMLDFIKDLEVVQRPVCIIWGDQDQVAPANVLEAYRAVPARMKNV